jgi:hypothetical protein
MITLYEYPIQKLGTRIHASILAMQAQREKELPPLYMSTVEILGDTIMVLKEMEQANKPINLLGVYNELVDRDIIEPGPASYERFKYRWGRLNELGLEGV